MAKPEKNVPVAENEVEETPKPKEKVAEPKVKETVEEEVDVRAELESLAKEADMALDEGKKWKAFSKILEAYTDIQFTQGEAKQVFSAVGAFITLAAYTEGTVRVPNFGSFRLVDVAEKKGVIKTGGESKEWISPAHTTLKFKAHDYLEEVVSYNEDEYQTNVLKPLLVDNLLVEEDGEAE